MTDHGTLRARLLELHKSLLDAERVRYERQHGRVTPNAFLQALTSDPSLTWLSPLSLAIVGLVDVLHQRSEDAELNSHLDGLRSLLRLSESEDAFAARYGALVQQVPDVAFAHAALTSALG